MDPTKFLEIDHAQHQFNLIQAYYIKQFNHLMLKLSLPNFNPNFFMLELSSDTIVEFLFRSQNQQIKQEKRMNTSKE